MTEFYGNVLKSENPITGRRIGETGSIINTADAARRLDATIDAFSQVHTAEYTPLIELKSSYGLSALRDRVTTEGNGDVTWGDGEFIVSGQGPGDTVFFRTAERGRYLAGLVGVPGLGVRVIDAPAGEGDEVRWGYFDDVQGFGFGIDPDGLFTFTRRAGVDLEKRRRADWLNDSLDGSGPSGLTLDATDGAAYRLPFIYYGYGTFTFEASVRGSAGRKDTLVECDVQGFPGQISVPDPNLPVAVELAGNCSVAVGGRQYGVFGRYMPNRRIVSDWRDSVSINNTAWTPLVSFRLKDAQSAAGNGFRSVSVKVAGAGILSDNDAIWALFLNPTLTGADFRTPRGHDAAETATEYDVSATAMTGGENIYKAVVVSGQGNRSGAAEADVPNLDVPTAGTVTLAARSFGASGSIKSVLRDRQEW